MDKCRLIPFAMLVAVMVLVPINIADGDSAHMSGEGHGEGIDVVYSSTEGDMGVAVITLRDLPADKVTVSFISLTDGQSVGPLPGERILNVFVRPLLQETYTVLVTLHTTSELIAECQMDVLPGLAVMYEANGGSGYMMPSGSDEDGNVVLATCTFIPPQGKQFSSWEMNGTTHQPGDSVRISQTSTAKAVWEDAVYTISFAPGEGTGSMPSATADYRQEITLPESTFSAPEGKSFDGWEHDGKRYSAGDKVTIEGNTVFTATWSSGSDMTMMIIIAAIALIAVVAIIIVIMKRRV